MVDVALAVAVLLMAAGVVGSVLPLLPSGLLSLAGVYVYVFFGAEPIGPLVLASLTLVGLVAVLLEQFAGPIAAKATGAATGTTVAAALGGIVLFFVAGPVGILVGMFAVVFGLELARGVAPPVAGRRSAYTVLGILASSAVQALLTAANLVAFLAVVVVL